MKKETAILVLLPIMGICSAAKGSERRNLISVTFSVDGKTVGCNERKLRLRLHGELIEPEALSGGFVVPATFNKKSSDWQSGDSVDVGFTCGEYSLNFQLHPSLVSSGRWEFGVEYPPHWIEYGWTGAIEHGTWLSYLVSECDDCEPGVVTYLSHSDAPPSIPARLREEQPAASGERARDVAYALAVFRVDHQQNRDYLVQLLTACLSRPKESSEDEVCDGKLLLYVTNLYWRGDAELLGPLLQMADSREDVIGDIGRFYANLLDRQPIATLSGMRNVSADKRRTICSLAGEFELRLDNPKFERVADHLRAAGDEVAGQCMQEAKRASGHLSKTRARTP